jgi:dipeptidyl aminopeptidase/acylaminoacyl peptidase
MRFWIFLCLLFLLPFYAHAQALRPLEHADVHRWRKTEQVRLSNDGQWACWLQTPVTEGDATLHLWNAPTQTTRVFARAAEPQFTADNRLLVFRVKPPLDTLKAQRRRKVKDDDLPKDTLVLYTLATGATEKIPRVKSVSVPDKWSGWLAFQIETAKPQPPKKDTAKTAEKPIAEKKGVKKPKKEDKDNGWRLLVRNTATGKTDTIAYTTQYVFAKRAPRLLLHTSGKGDTLPYSALAAFFQPGIYWMDLEKNTTRPLLRAKGKYQQPALDDSGQQAAFLSDTDTSKARIRPWALRYWSSSAKDSARVVVHPGSSFLKQYATPADTARWMVSENGKVQFSEDGSKLYFGAAPPPVLNDTTLLPEEIVNVEVWAWTEKRLYTEQEVRMENEKKRSYPVVWHVQRDQLVPLATREVPEVRFQEQRDAALALGFTEEPYAHYLTSEGTAHKDLYAIDVQTGGRQRIVRDLRCSPSLSPAARYIVWWSDPDTAWYAWGAATKTMRKLTDTRLSDFQEADNDVPDYPSPYGAAAWLENDAALLLYDQFDIWKADPTGAQPLVRLTNGKATRTRYRYVRLDPEKRFLRSDETVLVHQFNTVTKAEGYARLHLKTGQLTPWVADDFAYTRQPTAAQNAPALVFTRENYQTFPDLLYEKDWTKGAAGTSVRLSEVNPQQKEYQWGSIELIQWTSLSGELLSGLLVKPAGFDPAKQYPLIVNFYEKLSDELHRHRSPDFHRSQINWTFYASRGYVVFAPDIPYRTGYPGECAYDAIVSGVTHLIGEGFIDPARTALQGHSWGGYQAAYLVTRTNLFRCAEAGAPVANMTSAYGGIRWESGLSRAFQYERQQSRIGGTLWQYPMRFLENSPLFALDKVKTPLLIMHNDKDGAVPWYQGIELYTGLRRLGKPAWLLNYNDEPHWPVKLQNRADFQKRMQQFFDHYLKDGPLPRWMDRGIPPAEKGIGRE